MFSRVSALGPSRPLLRRLPCAPGGSEAAMETRGLRPLPDPARTEYKIQRCFGTNSVICCKKDESSVPLAKISENVPESQDKKKRNANNNLLDILKSMKVQLNGTDTLEDIKTHGTKIQYKEEIKTLKTTSSVSQKAIEDSAPESHQSLSPELVAAATAVAESLPFDKVSVKSELLSQLMKHEKTFREHQGKETKKISFKDIISDMKISKSSTSRIYTRPDHQIQFDEGHGFLAAREFLEPDSKKRQGVFKGKRLNIFSADPKTATETETSPTLWDMEFAKELAKLNHHLPQNALEEMIQWTKEGKLWTFPINNEAGIDDDGADFHEHIFLDKYLKDFPKRGPIRHFMELVTCGLSKNPFLTVKQKVEHIEWFRNYFHEKKDILEENNIQFN